MYPDLPYPGYTWHITHHMGVLDERNLYNILWAALTYANSRDPDAEINNYIIANRLVSNDVRQDTGQPAAWRDYQQMLSQLGLMFSDRVVKNITLTPLGLAYLDKALNFIEQDITRWTPGELDKDDKLRWYAWYGSIDLEITSIPTAQQVDEPNEDEFGKTDSTSSSQINLRRFDENLLATQSSSATTSRTAIELSYSLELSLSQRRLHDLMVALIANLCLSKGASVWDDPKTVDLLVRYQEMEFIIEVKTVTPRNFVNRIRYALGQILYYDYLRSGQSTAPRRKVIAIAANVADTSWCIPFLNGYMDIDLLSMRSNVLHVHSQMPITNQLFTAY